MAGVPIGLRPPRLDRADNLRLGRPVVLLFLHRPGAEHQLGLRPQPGASAAGSSGSVSGGPNGRPAAGHLLAHAPCTDSAYAKERRMIMVRAHFAARACTARTPARRKRARRNGREQVKSTSAYP